MKKRIFQGVVVLLLALLVGPGTGNSAGPWQWQFTLATEGSEGVMQMPTALFVDSGLQRYYVVDAGNNRLLSFDLEGKLLKQVAAPIVEESIFSFYPSTIKDGKLIQLIENEKEEWELHITGIE